jgi:hypothetical protein
MVVIYNRVALWPVTPMATPMATVKGKGNLNGCWYLLMTWRSHPTGLALKTPTQKYVLYLLCALFWRYGCRSQSFDYRKIVSIFVF